RVAPGKARRSPIQGAGFRGGRSRGRCRKHAASPPRGRGGRRQGPLDHAGARAVHRQRRHDRGRRLLWMLASPPCGEVGPAEGAAGWGDTRASYRGPLSRMELMGVKGWEVVFRGERLKADLIAAVLESNGIRVEVFGDHAYSAAMNFTEARIMVPDIQAERARELIEAGDSTQV